MVLYKIFVPNSDIKWAFDRRWIERREWYIVKSDLYRRLSLLFTSLYNLTHLEYFFLFTPSAFNLWIAVYFCSSFAFLFAFQLVCQNVLEITKI